MALLKKILFKNKSVGGTPVNDVNLNAMQDNTETAVNQLVDNIKTDTGNTIKVSIDNNYVMKIDLVNANGITISTATIDLPLETMVVNARYDNTTKEIIIVLENGTELKVPIGDIVNGLVNETTFNSKAEELQNNINTLSNDINAKITKINEEQATQNNKISNIELEQTTQNEKIQKNANDIITTNETIEEKYNKVKSNLINLSAEGEEIQVNDSSDLEAKIDVRGNTKQETTKGYNLLDISKFSDNSIEQNKNGINAKIVKDGIILNGTSNARTIITIKNDKPFNFSQSTIISILGKDKSGEAYIQVTISVDGAKRYINATDEQAILKSNSTLELNSIVLVIEANKTFTNELINAYIYTGNQNKPFEPYTGGQASPNPDYPQEIESVKGNVEVKQTGKNLFDKNAEPFRRNVWLQYTQSNNSISYVGDNGDDVYKIPIKEGIYTIKFAVAFPAPGFAILDKNNNVLYGEKQEKRQEITFMAPKGSAYGLFTFDKKDHEIGQIEKGTQATPYEPYQETLYPLTLGNIELNGTPDLRDKAYKENGKWYIDKKWGKKVFNENNQWFSTNIATAQRFHTSLRNIKPRKNFYSNRFIGKSYAEMPGEAMIYTTGEDFQILYLNFELGRFKDKAEFLEWIKLNPVEIVAELETPEKTEITDPVLINQLNALENAKMFKPTTVLTNNSIANMKLDYIADTKTYIDNKIKEIAKVNEEQRQQILQSTPQTIPEEKETI